MVSLAGIDQLAHASWDAVVIGAGPAGALMARQLARKGARVLLVDKCGFPRRKVCGCCLSPAAHDVLGRVGLGNLAAREGAVRLERLLLACDGRSAEIPLAGSVSLSREAFDTALVRAAVDEGATFLAGVQARLGSTASGYRHVELRSDRSTLSVRANVVIAATGLGNGLARRNSHFRPVIARNSRFGVGAVLKHSPAGYEPHTIYMAVGAEGYVGAVRLENGGLDIAAALDASCVREAGGIGPVVERVVRASGLPALPWKAVHWQGTPQLTQRLSNVASERIFVIGDAAGYVEPFTGEGIAWALASACEAAPLALLGIQHWSVDLEREWDAVHARLLARRMRECRWISGLLRRPALARAAVALLAAAPAAGSRIVRHVHTPLSA
jgi:flavin-dependent dehydrogenase